MPVERVLGAQPAEGRMRVTEVEVDAVGREVVRHDGSGSLPGWEAAGWHTGLHMSINCKRA